MLINVDLGECLKPNPDKQIMPHIDIANVACGGHVGDEKSIEETVKLAKKHQVNISAHISYCDKKNFGRQSIDVKPTQLFEQLLSQLELLNKYCQKHQLSIDYIKPHGALYHDVANKISHIKIVIDLIQLLDSSIKLIMPYQCNANIIQLVKEKNIHLLYEVFSDRRYTDDTYCQLTKRSEKNSVFTNVDLIINQYKLFKNKTCADTICFHSDNKASVLALQQLHNAT